LVQKLDILLVIGVRGFVKKLDILDRVRLINRGRRVVARFDVSGCVLAHLLCRWLFLLLRPPHDRAEPILSRQINHGRWRTDSYPGRDRT